MADYNVGSVEVRVQTAAEKALQSLDALIAKLNEVSAPINALSPALKAINSVQGCQVIGPKRMERMLILASSQAAA